MKTRTSLLTLALCLATAAASFGADALMGNWKLNTGKSTLARGTGKNPMVVYDWAPIFRTKVTVDSVDARGRKTRSEWIGHLDGDDYPVTGDPFSDMRSYKKINDNTFDYTSKKNGKVVNHGRIMVAADGKTRTVISWSKNRKGRMVRSTAVYDRVDNP